MQKSLRMFAALFYIAYLLANVYVYRDAGKILKMFTPPRSDPVRHAWPPTHQELEKYHAELRAAGTPNWQGYCFNYEAKFNMELFCIWVAWIQKVSEFTFIMVFFVIRRRTIYVYHYKRPNDGVFIC